MEQNRIISRSVLAALLVVLTGLVIWQVRLTADIDIIGTLPLNSSEQNIAAVVDGHSGHLYVGTAQNRVVAYDSEGSLQWQLRARGAIQRITLDGRGAALLAGSEDRSIYLIDRRDGETTGILEVRGRVHDLDLHPETGHVLVSSGVSSIRHFIALFSDDQEPLWETDIGIRSQAARFVSNTIVYGTDRGEIVQVNLNGDELARLRLDSQITSITTEGYDGFIVTTDRGSLYFFDSRLIQKGGIRGPERARVVAVAWDSGLVVVGTADRTLNFLESATGRRVKSYSFPRQLTSATITDRNLLVTSRDGYVYRMDRAAIAGLQTAVRSHAITRYALIAVGALIAVFTVLSFASITNRVRSFSRVLAKHRTAYLMLLPIFGLLAVFHYYPVLRALGASFTDWNVHSPVASFNGLENFRLMISEGYFLGGVRNLALILTAAMVKLFTMPLLAAKLVFHMREPGKRLFRLLFVFPMVIPVVIGALIWQNIYDPNIGLLNNLLETIGLPGLRRVWLGSEQTAIWAIIFMGFPFIDAFPFLVYYGGLISIPSELFEASKLDGSNGWWDFWKIQLPLIGPQIKLLVILTFIMIVQDFAPILILTGGGPGRSTYVPGLELYYNIARFGRFGYASALGLVMFVVIFGGTLLNLRIRTSSDNEI